MFMVDLEETIDCAVNYLLGDRSIFNAQNSLFQKTFLAYLADKNSSTLREAVTLRVLECTKIDKKHGADGVDKKGIYIEVKPSYAHLDKNGKQNRLGGGGCFNDITYKKVESCKGWDVVCSGFAEDKLLYVVRFPFDYLAPVLNDYITKKVEKNKKITEGQTQGRFTAIFTYRNYVDCQDLKVIYLNRNDGQPFMNKNMYKAFDSKYNA